MASRTAVDREIPVNNDVWSANDREKPAEANPALKPFTTEAADEYPSIEGLATDAMASRTAVDREIPVNNDVCSANDRDKPAEANPALKSFTSEPADKYPGIETLGSALEVISHT